MIKQYIFECSWFAKHLLRVEIGNYRWIDGTCYGTLNPFLNVWTFIIKYKTTFSVWYELENNVAIRISPSTISSFFIDSQGYKYRILRVRTEKGKGYKSYYLFYKFAVKNKKHNFFKRIHFVLSLCRPTVPQSTEETGYSYTQKI